MLNERERIFNIPKGVLICLIFAGHECNMCGDGTLSALIDLLLLLWKFTSF